MLYEIENLVEADVIKRPSKNIKTPYVADIIHGETEYLAHTPALGCCGLADVGATVLVAPSKNKKSKCDYTVYLSKFVDKIHPDKHVLVGIHPKLAEYLVESALKQNLLSKLPNIRCYKRETVIKLENTLDSRFDFSGIDENGCPFLLEIKNVPLADYEDITAKERKNKDYSDRLFNSKVAYFPDGYRKNSKDPVSPRALKHIEELTTIRKMSRTRCLLGFVIQRTDVEYFQTSVIDPIYKEAVKIAKDNGVEIFAMVVNWDKNGCAHFVCDDLKILF